MRHEAGEDESPRAEQWGYSTLSGSAPAETTAGAAAAVAVDRRRVLKYAGLVGVGMTGGAGAIALTSDPAAARINGTLDATDQSVSDDDGSLSSLSIDPSVTVDWDSQSDQVAQIDYTWHVSVTNNGGTVGTTPYTRSVSSPATSGSQQVSDFGTINLLSANGGTLSASTFESNTDGATNETQVTLSLDVVLKDDQANIIDQDKPLLRTTFTVIVSNEATSTLSGDGTANTAAQS